MRPRYWMYRLYVALSAGLSMLVVWIEPASLGNQIISKSGPIGWPCVAVLGVVSCVAVVDAVLNDMFGLAVRWKRALRWRHWVFMALAMGLASVSYVCVMAVGYTPLVLPFLLDATFATLVAITGLFHLYRSEQ